MYTISGSGYREFVGFAPYIRAVVGKVTDPYAAYVLFDSFTDTNGTSLDLHTAEKGGPWTEQAGTWTIQSNMAQSADAGELRAHATLAATQDFQIDLITAPSGTIDAGFAWRMDGASNEYWARWYNGGPNQIQYWEANGSYPGTKLGQYNMTVDLSTTYVMRVTAIGSDHTIYSDDVSVITFTDATHNANTKAGMCRHSGDGGSVWNDAEAV